MSESSNEGTEYTSSQEFEITKELPEFLEGSKEVFEICRADTEHGQGFFASDPEKRYPWIYPRDTACLINGLVDLGDYDTAKGCCEYLLSCQLENGQWVQRYTEGSERADVKQEEDGASLATWAILTYIEKSGDKDFAEQVQPNLERAVSWIEEEARDELEKYGLVHSHASIHEAIDCRTNEFVNLGFEIWNNSVTAKALEMMGKTYNDKHASDLAEKIKRGIKQHLVVDGRFIRRLTDNGEQDQAPDMMMLAPSYFNLFERDELIDGKNTFENLVNNTLENISENLEDKNLGGFRRFPGMDYRDQHSEYKGIVDPLLPGPWIHFTAWVAQVYVKQGEREKASEIVKWILKQSENGQLPEHLVDSQVFHKYYKEEIEYHKRTKKDGSAKDKAVGNLETMAGNLEDNKTASVEYCKPLLWAHIETLRALKLLDHIEEFKVEEKK